MDMALNKIFWGKRKKKKTQTKKSHKQTNKPMSRSEIPPEKNSALTVMANAL